MTTWIRPERKVKFFSVEFIKDLTQIKVAIPDPGYGGAMNKCIESMMLEHDLIVQVLSSLQRMAEKAAAGDDVPRGDVAGFGRFFRDFADKCHHGKEEERLFVKMVEAGFPRHGGPIAVMLSEHDAGREEVRGLNQLGAGSGPLSAAETAELIDYASRFVPLLYAHIQKENNILYPMAQSTISPGEFARLDASCAAFDQEIRERLDVAALKALAADLVDKYPSNSADLAVYGACGACSSTA